MEELQVIARYTLAAGKEDEVLELLPQLAAASRTEPGNISYVVYRSLEDDREVVLLERYTSRAAFDAHRETQHFKELALGRIVPLLQRRVVEVFDVAE